MTPPFKEKEMGIEARNIGQAFTWSVMGSEAIQAIHDLRWMIVLVVILIIADFRFGREESRMLHKQATEQGNDVLAKMTEFHLSRAIRRTCNKFIDYMTLLLVFCIFGLAVTEPYGLCSHTITAGMAVIFAYVCEIASIFGHILVLKGIEKPKFTWLSTGLFLGRVLASFAKTKSEDFGNALDETVQQTFADKKNERKKDDVEPVDMQDL